jgi:hypothetical protein
MKKIPTEYQECRWFYDWAQTHPLVKEYLIHHANEGKRTSVYGRLLKLIGLRPGIPDYQLPIPVGKHHGLWLEMKRRNAQKHKKKLEQENWAYRLKKINHIVDYAYGWEDAMNKTLKYLNNELD